MSGRNIETLLETETFEHKNTPVRVKLLADSSYGYYGFDIHYECQDTGHILEPCFTFDLRLATFMFNDKMPPHPYRLLTARALPDKNLLLPSTYQHPW